MLALLVVGSALLVLVLVYALEQIFLQKHRSRIPLRICVTGTRGKSSVVRTLAAAFRGSGRSVLAKTTGSRPMLLLPDGSEFELQRPGRPSVLEQLQLLRLAAARKVEVVVSEMMGIRPEILRLESRRIFKPQVLVLTNARSDHREHWGSDRESAARCLAEAVCEGCAVFVPEEGNQTVWQEAAARVKAELHPVPAGSGGQVDEEASQGDSKGILPGDFRFEADRRLVEAVTDYVGLDKQTVREGVDRVSPDLGGLKIWRWQEKRPLDTIQGQEPQAPEQGRESGALQLDCVSAFAANDPESTRKVLEVLEGRGWLGEKQLWGLLNLRRDRGDRTLQWLESFGSGEWPEISELFVMGDPSRAFARRLWASPEKVRCRIIRDQRPEVVMSALAAQATGAAVLILGMGNVGGAGRELIEYWEREGERVAV